MNDTASRREMMGGKGRHIPVLAKVPAYAWIASLYVFVVLGFYPTYFSRLGKTNLVHHVHALVAMSWLLLLVAQVFLAQRRIFRWHRLLGRVSFFLAPLFVITLLEIIHVGLTAHGQPLPPAGLAVFFNDVALLSYFCVCYGLGITYRRRRELHQRYMMCTALVVIPPALSRVLLFDVPGVGHLTASVAWATAFIVLVLLVVLWMDLRRRKLYAPYWGSLLFFVAATAAMPFVGYWPAWRHFAQLVSA